MDRFSRINLKAQKNTAFSQDLAILFRDEVGLKPDNAKAAADVFEKCDVLCANDFFDFIEDTDTGIDDVLGKHKKEVHIVSKKKIARWLKDTKKKAGILSQT